jgi:hypothetical protein
MRSFLIPAARLPQFFNCEKSFAEGSPYDARPEMRSAGIGWHSLDFHRKGDALIGKSINHITEKHRRLVRRRSRAEGFQPQH